MFTLRCCTIIISPFMYVSNMTPKDEPFKFPSPPQDEQLMDFIHDPISSQPFICDAAKSFFLLLLC